MSPIVRQQQSRTRHRERRNSDTVLGNPRTHLPIDMLLAMKRRPLQLLEGRPLHVEREDGGEL